MKFKHGTRRRALEYEKDWVQRWKADKTFEKSVENRPKDNSYVFYDGPPFISGNPHHGTLLSSIVKDAIPRYQTMKGKRVERVWGWDCHGLPAERFTEKKLGLTSREEVIDYGLEKYIVACRNNMVQTSSEWNDVVDRIGRWVDMDNAYKTMDKEYMESVWWAFKELYEKGKIYEGEKVLMYCTLDATPLSKAEVTMDAGAYQDVTDPSVYVKFKLVGDVVGKIMEIDEPEFHKDPMPKNRLAVRALVVDENDRVALLHSKKYGYYELPGGGLESGEDLEAAAIRETEEETGFRVEVTNALGWVEAKISPSKYKNMNHGYLCRLLGEGEAKFNQDEQDADLEVVWVESFAAAIQTIEKNGEGYPTKRDRAIIQSAQRLREQGQSTLLAWTTTPWTLPANTALAVNKDLTYAEVKVGDEQFILAKSLLEKVLQDEKHQPLPYEIVCELKGDELVGLSYEPLLSVDRGEGAHKVWAADYVSHEDGTGIVHLAPAYGEEDFEIARKNNIPVVHTIDENGYFTEGDWTGQNVWETNKQIAKELKERGTVWKIDYIRHSYPHCHRCGTRLMYRAHPSWFMDIAGQRQEMIDNNQPINWFPPHVKHGRFEKTIQQAPDWNLSRDRFWATAMPVWKSESGKVKVVGSYAELKELSGVELEDYHRPWIDDVTFTIDNETYTRIDKVMDCWFESGSMPFAQFHYPFENKDKFEANFPGDFIVEYVGQVRAWFYYVHAVNTALFGTHAFNNVIVTGNVAGNDGRKMSKSYGNYTDPNELMDKFSADSLRFLLLSSPLLSGEDFALQDKEVGDVARKLSMVWNMYDFFTMYAEVDGWEYDGELTDPLSQLTNPLDRWIVGRVHGLTAEVEKHMDAYNIPDALSPILPFLDDASNWYVRRSRRRFWKSEDDSDKNNAYKTLHYVLVRLAYVLAPFAPFMAEELYHNLTGDDESIHLKDWLSAGPVDQPVLDAMAYVRSVINDGLSQRAAAGVKTRQPLLKLSCSQTDYDRLEPYEEIVLEELNVKFIEVNPKQATPLLDMTITPELRREGQSREIIRFVQNARKQAGLNVDDRIRLQLETKDSELQTAIDEFTDIIQGETLAEELSDVQDGYRTEVRIDDAELCIALKKAD